MVGAHVLYGVHHFQTILALVMAPMMTARAIIEERTDETIELWSLVQYRSEVC